MRSNAVLAMKAAVVTATGHCHLNALIVAILLLADSDTMGRTKKCDRASRPRDETTRLSGRPLLGIADGRKDVRRKAEGSDAKMPIAGSADETLSLLLRVKTMSWRVALAIRNPAMAK